MPEHGYIWKGVYCSASVPMPRSRCPACGSILSLWLEQLSSHLQLDYYRCESCGHVWNVAKEDPAATPPPVPPLPAKSKSKKKSR
jgi:predicted RNA-binding Zn-ribbon protein involved in translation (DUF1610 family)